MPIQIIVESYAFWAARFDHFAAGNHITKLRSSREVVIVAD